MNGVEWDWASNEQFDPDNGQCLVETNLSSPDGSVYVDILESASKLHVIFMFMWKLWKEVEFYISIFSMG